MIASRLERALLVHAATACLTLTFGEASIRPWSSATFEGERIRLTVGGEDGPSFSRLLVELSEAELPMRGCYVADLVIRSMTGGEAELEALVLRDA